MNKPTICLIGGSGRSGTTIIKKIFGKHPDVALTPGEWRFIIDPDGLVDFFNAVSSGWTPYYYDVKVRRLEKLLKDVGKRSFVGAICHRAINRLGLSGKIPYNLITRYANINIERFCPDYFMLVEELIKELIDFQYNGQWAGSVLFQQSIFTYKAPFDKHELARIIGGFFRKVVNSVVDNQGSKHFIEDTPWNILCFNKLLELLPEAKLVHIYRDPRDVVASYMKQPWAPSDPLQAANWYKGIMEQWQAVKGVIPCNSYKEISLEDLVADPKNILKGVCEIWDMEWDDSLLETDLTHSHSGRWKKDLTPGQQKQVSDILGDQLDILGYE